MIFRTDVLKRGRQTVEQVLESLGRFTSCLKTDLSSIAAQSESLAQAALTSRSLSRFRRFRESCHPTRKAYRRMGSERVRSEPNTTNMLGRIGLGAQYGIAGGHLYMSGNI